MLGQSISKNSLILCGFAILTAAILSGTFLSTKSRIAEAERQAAEKALLQIIPRERHDNNMLDDVWPIPSDALTLLHLNEPENVHIAKKNGKPIAAIIPAVAPDGYTGSIKFIVGINIDHTIAGVRILIHKETPGLGDKIDLKKDNWVLSFNGKSLFNPSPDKWGVKKDGGEFDQFTGATITPRAVVKKVKTVLEYFETHRSEMFNESKRQ